METSKSSKKRMAKQMSKKSFDYYIGYVLSELEYIAGTIKVDSNTAHNCLEILIENMCQHNEFHREEFERPIGKLVIAAGQLKGDFDPGDVKERILTAHNTLEATGEDIKARD